MEKTDGWVIWVETEATRGLVRTSANPELRKDSDWWIWGCGRTMAFRHKEDALAFARRVRRPRKEYAKILHVYIMPFRFE